MKRENRVHMSNITIRQASLEDLPDLLKLEQNIIDSERPYDPYIKEDNVSYYDIPELISDAGSHLVVVESGNEIIGSGYAQIRPSKPCLTHEKHCYLGFIYLKPVHRGKALGHKIIDKLKKWGVSKGMQHFQLGVYAENKSAIRAYEKAGFKNVSVMMELIDE